MVHWPDTPGLSIMSLSTSALVYPNPWNGRNLDQPTVDGPLEWMDPLLMEKGWDRKSGQIAVFKYLHHGTTRFSEWLLLRADASQWKGVNKITSDSCKHGVVGFLRLTRILA